MNSPHGQIYHTFYTHQSHRFRVLKFNISDSFETARFITSYQSNISHFAHGREKLFQIFGSDFLRQLHTENGSSVALLRCQIVDDWRRPSPNRIKSR